MTDIRLLWCDLETTGLDPNDDFILEIAATVSMRSKPLTLLVNPIAHVLTCRKRMMDIHPKVREMHTANGLFDETVYSTTQVHEVEEELLRIVPEPDESEYDTRTVVAGSSAHFDLGFLRRHMPRLAKRLSHRVYDVSMVKMLCVGLGMPRLERKDAHRAVSDLRQSLSHLRACFKWLNENRPEWPLDFE